ncbi:MAG: hypothetical protein JXA30_07085 [Deltaproteobacteria bacterium]|nr:hypothetical protein [Deltaproteobacteria bacterium]
MPELDERCLPAAVIIIRSQRSTRLADRVGLRDDDITGIVTIDANQ